MFADPHISFVIIVALIALLIGVVIGVSLARPTINRY